MKCRLFIAELASAVTWPLMTSAQQPSGCGGPHILL